MLVGYWNITTLDGHKLINQIKPLALSLYQFILLMILFEEDGHTQVEIDQRGILPGYSTTRVIDQLEKSGYVERQRHETSRRASRILLTSKGQEVANESEMTNLFNEGFNLAAGGPVWFKNPQTLGF